MRLYPNAKCSGEATPTKTGALEVYITPKGKGKVQVWSKLNGDGNMN